jgi:hypothetical protein
MLPFKKISFFVILLVGIYSCSPEMKKFYGKQSGNVTLKKGETFAITLPEEHSKGETWSVQPVLDPAMLEYQQSKYNGKEEGTTDFIFEAKQPGQTEVVFKLIVYSDLADSVRIPVRVE